MRNKAIDAIINEDLPILNLTFKPQYNPFTTTGVMKPGEERCVFFM